MYLAKFWAPEKPGKTTTSIANENDVYTFRNQDKYYSNGLLFHYRFVPERGKWLSSKSTNTKFIVDFELIHKFFTPQDIRFEDIDAN